MLFLIDFENVGNAGMKGCDHLDARDHVIVFYSEARKQMERGTLEKITSSGCAFDICKLCKAGKNALDFYIASRLGELIGERYEGGIVIVSSDSGFQAVREYWEKRALNKRKVLISSCIEDGIVSGNENDERTKMLRHFTLVVCIHLAKRVDWRFIVGSDPVRCVRLFKTSDAYASKMHCTLLRGI